MDLHDDVKTFFDEFVEVFLTFDGAAIALRYSPPYLAVHADGSSNCFVSHDAVASYFQRVVDEYRAKACRACRYRDLQVITMGENAALGTVTWDLLKEDGVVITSWRESYNLARTDGKLRAFATVDHS